MHTLSLFIYNIAIYLYGAGIYVASFFNHKASLWIEGRKARPQPLNSNSGKRIWFHCASLGEFEQARPVIEALKKKDSTTQIILTFFSPSGYEIRKNYEHASVVMYLPLDTKDNAAQFLDAIQPDVAVFVKYEFWYNYLAGCKTRNIPTLLFSGIFREGQVFFKWYGGLFREMLQMFSAILVQNDNSAALLKSIGINSEVAFDTRFDRVYQIAEQRKSFPAMEKFKGQADIFIAGSTWKADDDIIVEQINTSDTPDKWIIAPHDINETRIVALQNSISKFTVTRLSKLTEANAVGTKVLLVDSIGHLASLYAYAYMAYVGGGFNASVHNVLEPAVYGIPVIFGPNHTKSAEAMELKEMQAAFEIEDGDHLFVTIALLQTQTEMMNTAKENAKAYVMQRLGGTDKVLQKLATLIQ